jgi:60 kDa SS-A/Ro ribonucleoprotein
MARMNTVLSGPPVRTHEGAPAVRLTPIRELRRSVLTALLWEDGFYEKGSALAARVADLVPQCRPEDVAALAIEARDTMYLRHVPLFLVRQLARIKGNGAIVQATLTHVIQRPDEMGEYLAMYWNGQTAGTSKRPEPLSAGSKRGLADAFRKFSAYQLAKYDRDSGVKLRDVLRLVHAKAQNVEQGALWKRVIARDLETPDTWEVSLSAGKNKRETFERLLTEKKLGALAFLRNLRNMIEAGVDPALVRARFAGPLDKVLPFRFIAAVRHAPAFAQELNDAMLRVTAELPRLAGTTIVLVDVSPSMAVALSAKSEMQRMDAGTGLAVLIREVAESARVFAFSSHLGEVPAYRGLALADMIRRAVPSNGTLLGTAGAAYMINLSTSKHGVGYGQGWTAHIDGWSERVLDFIHAVEADAA